MKKLLTAMLAVAMTVFMAMPAFAATSSSTADAGKGSITVTNPQEGATYTAYKIFDVTYDGDGHYAYTISANSPWFELVVKDFFNTTPTANDASILNVDTTALKDNKTVAQAAAAFNAVDKTMVASEYQKVLQKVGETMQATDLPLGYYFVTTGATGAVCNLTTTDSSVNIVDKNEVPDFNKTVDDTDANVEIGQELTYTITGKVPDTTGYTEYTYEVSDAMSAGLTYIDGVTVKFGDEAIDTTGKYTLNDNGFTLTFNMVDYQQYVGKTITIIYKAKVNENAVTTEAGNPNKAQLKYSNDPTDNTKFGTDEKVVKVYTCNINILKYDGNHADKKLAGAKFKLYNADGKYYKWDEANKAVTWVDDAKDATEVVTTDDGKASFKGLEAGSYTLTETEAPAGYNKLTSDINVVINRGDDAITATVNGVSNGDISNPVKVPNSTGTILPSTGDMGTKVLYALGGLMAAGAVIALVARKRASRH